MAMDKTPLTKAVRKRKLKLPTPLDMKRLGISKGVLKVGGGCGFVVQTERNRLVITAAHCLPRFPPCHSASYLKERMYQKLLGEIGKKPTVWAQCLFVDPISDIAVLGPPDYCQELSDQWKEYEQLMKLLSPLSVDDVHNTQAWLRNLKGEWFPCTVEDTGGALWISNAKDGIAAGMSGSPIVADDGAAIGVVCTAGGVKADIYTEGGPNPRLAHHLPGWLLRELLRPAA
jgi:hypothetical protein